MHSASIGNRPISNTAVTIGAEAVPNPRRHAFDKAKRWGTLLAKFVSVQIIVQAIGLVAGLLLIRTLSQKEYAYFTLANTMQATLLLLADVGVGSALSATGGKVWQDQQRFSELIQTGLHIRKNLAWIGGAIALPILCWMLIRNGTSVGYALLLAGAVLLGANYRLTTDVLTMVPRLHGRIDQLQKLDLGANVFRLAVLGAACLTYVNAAVAVLVASLSFGLQYVLIRRWAAKAVDLQAPTSAADRQTIFRVVKQMAPNTIYFCVQGQLSVFLISVFGSTKTLAEVGALGRLAVLFSIIGSVISSVVLPRFARCQNKARLKAMWWQIMGGYAALSLMLLALAIYLPGPFLWLLGKSYAHLDKELAYIIFSVVVGNLVGTIYGLNASRGWTQGAWLAIPIVLLGQIVLARTLDLGTVAGVALFISLPFIPSTVPYLYRTYKSLQMPQCA